MKCKSKAITSNQSGPHDNLYESLERNQGAYQRPIADFSHKLVAEIISIVAGRDVIFDMCCGVGESTYHLGSDYPDHCVIGIDKSEDRLGRKNKFKKSLPKNVYLFRGELLDLWYLLAQKRESGELVVTKQYILYPNPYPKSTQLKKRWHGNPVAPYIFKLSDKVEVRSNWEIYIDEFNIAGKFFDFNCEKVVKEIKSSFMTPFEKKYSESGQTIYSTILIRS